MRFLTCEPNLDPSVPCETYEDEADIFFSNPNQWFLTNQHDIQVSTTHLVLFENLFNEIRVDLEFTPVGRFLSRFAKCDRFLFSFIEQSKRVGKYIMLCEASKQSESMIDFDSLEINSEF
jgi:hypothetical protein